jgi:hypothetical protein
MANPPLEPIVRLLRSDSFSRNGLSGKAFASHGVIWSERDRQSHRPRRLRSARRSA